MTRFIQIPYYSSKYETKKIPRNYIDPKLKDYFSIYDDYIYDYEGQ